MKNKILILIVSFLVVYFLGSWFISARSNLSTLEEGVMLHFSNVQEMLLKRNNLVPNLVDTVKASSNYKGIFFSDIADAHFKLKEAISKGDINAIKQADSSLDTAINNILSIKKDYPELETNEQFIAIHNDIEKAKEMSNVAIQYYNDSVNLYNTTLYNFSNNIVVRISGFKEAEHF